MARSKRSGGNRPEYGVRAVSDGLPDGAQVAIRLPRGEFLLAGRSDFEGRTFLNLRVWYVKEGWWHGTKRGITVPAELRETVQDALGKILNQWNDLPNTGDGSVSVADDDSTDAVVSLL